MFPSAEHICRGGGDRLRTTSIYRSHHQTNDYPTSMFKPIVILSAVCVPGAVVALDCIIRGTRESFAARVLSPCINFFRRHLSRQFGDQNLNHQLYLHALEVFRENPPSQYARQLVFNDFLNAARKGHREAMMMTAQLYETGYGTKRSFSDAFQWYLKVATTFEDSDACFKVADYFSRGFKDVRKPTSKANNSTTSLSSLVEDESNSNDNTSLNSSSTSKSHHFYRITSCKTPTDRNLSKRFYFLKKAADQNHSRAQYLLGLCFDYGSGCEPNMNLAMDYFLRSAIGGDVDSCLEVMHRYENGVGTSRNMKHARFWLEEWNRRKERQKDTVDDSRSISTRSLDLSRTSSLR